MKQSKKDSMKIKLILMTIMTLLIGQSACLSLKKQTKIRKVPKFYHNQSQIQQIINNYASIYNKTNESAHNLWVQKTTCDGYGMISITSQWIPNNKAHKLNAVIVCNVHARQLFAAQACLEFIQQLVKSDHEVSEFPSPEYLTKNINFHIYYQANQMREQVFAGEYCRRTDKNNVDLNRNFPTGFKGQNIGDQTNPGPYALSEPFSKCLQATLLKIKPDIFLDIHTGQFSLYQVKVNESASYPSVLPSLLNACPNCRIRSQQLQGLMFMDAQIRHKVKWSNLLEIYGGFNSNLQKNKPQQFCFTIFNPWDKQIYNYYLDRAVRMMGVYFASVLQKEGRSIQ